MLQRRRLFDVWSPLQLRGGLLGWWDPSRLGLATNTACAQDDDLAGGNPFVQATGANRPLFVSDGINGRGALRFTAASQHFMTADGLAASLSGNDTPFTMFGVVQVDDGATQTPLSLGSAVSGDPRHEIVRKSVSNVAVTLRRGDADGSVTSSNGSAFPATPIAFCALFTGATFTLFSRDVATPLINNAALDTGAMTVARFTMGCLRTTTNSLFMSGYWGERFLASGTLERRVIANGLKYLSRKWGI